MQIMNDDIKETIDQLANSLQTVTLLSTQRRRELGNSAQQAVDLEAASGERDQEAATAQERSVTPSK